MNGDVDRIIRCCSCDTAFRLTPAAWERAAQPPGVRCPACNVRNIRDAGSTDDPDDWEEEPEPPPVSAAAASRLSRSKGILDGHRYYAFISYRRTDAASVKWLHRALESYRIPQELEGRKGLPERLYPVFRDQDELAAASDLTAELISALKASKYLIVVCSPDTPASKWVNQEVQTFIDLGRRKRILPIIVRGEDPNALFPPALRASDVGTSGSRSSKPLVPLAADAVQDGRRLAFLKIVAAILECRLEELRRRDQMQIRRQRIALGAISCATILLIGILSIAFLYQRGRAATLSASIPTVQREAAKEAGEKAKLQVNREIEQTKAARLETTAAKRATEKAEQEKQQAERKQEQSDALAKQMEESALIARRKAYDARLAEASKIALQSLDANAVASMLTKESEFPMELRTFAWGLLYNLRTSPMSAIQAENKVIEWRAKEVAAIALSHNGKQISLLDREGRLALIDAETAAIREVVMPEEAWRPFQGAIDLARLRYRDFQKTESSYQQERSYFTRPVRLQFMDSEKEVRAITMTAIFTCRFVKGETIRTENKTMAVNHFYSGSVVDSVVECNERGTIVAYIGSDSTVRLVPLSEKPIQTSRLLSDKPKQASVRIKGTSAERPLEFPGQAGRMIDRWSHLLLVRSPGHVSIWNTNWNRKRAQTSASGFPSKPLAIEFSDDGQLLAALDSELTLRTWRVKYSVDQSRDQPRQQISNLELTVTGPERVIPYTTKPDTTVLNSALLMSHSGQLVGRAIGRLLQVWDMSNGKTVAEVTGDNMALAELSADGLNVAYWQKGKVYRTRLRGRAAKSHRGCVDLNHDLTAPCGIAFSADGSRIATADRDGRKLYWKKSPQGEFERQDISQKHQLEDDFMAEVTVKSPIRCGYGQPEWSTEIDGFSLEYDARTRVHTALTIAKRPIPQSQAGRQQLRFRTPARVTSVALSADATILAAGTEKGHVLLWRLLEESQTPLTLERHAAAVTALCWSPDGKTLATGTKDGKLCCWDPLFAPLQPQLTIDAHGDEITCLRFSPDGKTLASGSRDRKITLWEAKFPAAGAVTVTP